MKKVAVLGSAGFIASYVIEELHNRDIEVIGLQRHVGFAYQGGQADEVYIGDIKDAEIVEKVISKADAVINLSGILGTSETINNPYPAIEVNILGTLHALQACRIWKKPFVQIAVGNHWMNNTYSITRTTAERLTLMYAKEHGVEANVVRALNAYGPRQSFASYKKIIPSFTLAALKGLPIKINGDGNQIMDMVYVEDVATFLVNTLLDPEEIHTKVLNRIVDEDSNYRKPEYHKEVDRKNLFGNIYQCGSAKKTTVNDIAEMIIKISKSKSQIEHVPMRAGEPINSVVIADYELPGITRSLESGLETTIAYYKDNLHNYN